MIVTHFTNDEVKLETVINPQQTFNFFHQIEFPV